MQLTKDPLLQMEIFFAHDRAAGAMRGVPPPIPMNDTSQRSRGRQSNYGSGSRITKMNLNRRSVDNRYPTGTHS